MDKAPMSETHLIYSMFPTKDAALAAAKALVEKRLAACANITNGATSIYRWEGKIQQEEEATLIAKTTDGKLMAAMEEIKRLHPYRVPCIVSYPIAQGHAPFLQWIADETR
jgi:periplasmic divalent cation tolerance protein